MGCKISIICSNSSLYMVHGESPLSKYYFLITYLFQKYYCNINATDVTELTPPCSFSQKILCYDDKNLATKEHGG